MPKVIEMTEFEMERRAEITRAEMIVAKDFGKTVSGLIVVIACLLSIHAVFWVPVAAGAYYAVTFRYRRNAARAEDEWFGHLGRPRCRSQIAQRDRPAFSAITWL